MKGIPLLGVPFGPNMPLAPLHWHIADRYGAFVAEPMADGVKVYPDPVGVLTNNPPFPFHLTNLTQYRGLSAAQPDNTLDPALELSPFGQGMGAVGLPVFSGFSGGPGAFAGVTGGYLIGFLLMALVMWLGERLFGTEDLVFVLSGIGGLAVCYLFGTVWFLLLYTSTTGPIGVWAVLASCVFPFLVPDGVKLALAFLLRRRLRKAMRL